MFLPQRECPGREPELYNMALKSPPRMQSVLHHSTQTLGSWTAMHHTAVTSILRYLAPSSRLDEHQRDVCRQICQRNLTTLRYMSLKITFIKLRLSHRPISVLHNLREILTIPAYFPHPSHCRRHSQLLQQQQQCPRASRIPLHQQALR